jgi:hypothetical protein
MSAGGDELEPNRSAGGEIPPPRPALGDKEPELPAPAAGLVRGVFHAEVEVTDLIERGLSEMELGA